MSMLLFESGYIIQNPNNNLYISLYQAISQYVFVITILHIQVLYSYSAFVLFVTPKEISSKTNNFIIYIFPWILAIILIIYMIFIPNFSIYFGCASSIDDSSGKIIYYSLVLILFILNIFYTIKLLKRIKRTLLEASINSFTNKKYNFYKGKLIKYIIGMFIVFHVRLIIVPLRFSFAKSDDVIAKLPVICYIYGIQISVGIVYYFVYVYNSNLFRMFMVLIIPSKEDQYKKQFEEEQKIFESSENSSLDDTLETTKSMVTLKISENDLKEGNDINDTINKNNKEIDDEEF